MGNSEIVKIRMGKTIPTSIPRTVLDPQCQNKNLARKDVLQRRWSSTGTVRLLGVLTNYILLNQVIVSLITQTKYLEAVDVNLRFQTFVG